MNVRLNPAQKIKVADSMDIFLIMQHVLRRENKLSRQKEHFWAIGLNSANVILYIELVSLGSVNATVVNPMEVYSLAVHKKSVNLILVHNHPSGNLTPSKNDKDVIKNLIKGGKLLGINVHDSLIISTEDYFSFKDKGLIK